MTTSATPEPIDGDDVRATNSWSSPPPTRASPRPCAARHLTAPQIRSNAAILDSQGTHSESGLTSSHSKDQALVYDARVAALTENGDISTTTARNRERRTTPTYLGSPRSITLREQRQRRAERTRKRRLTACPASSPMKEAWPHHRRRRRAPIRRPILSEESR
ncbi:hypothetical protein DFP72DRAFT_907905, partial [Ephemerocybe angulata]